MKQNMNILCPFQFGLDLAYCQHVTSNRSLSFSSSGPTSRPPGLLTVTSEHIRFFSFSLLIVGSVRWIVENRRQFLQMTRYERYMIIMKNSRKLPMAFKNDSQRHCCCLQAF